MYAWNILRNLSSSIAICEGENDNKHNFFKSSSTLSPDWVRGLSRTQPVATVQIVLYAYT